MTKNVLILLMYTYALTASEVDNSRMVSYIEQYKYIAIEEMLRTKIPASIKLAQAILESHAGSSTLAVKANNHFGIKCGDRWGGKSYYLKDDDYDKQGNHIRSCFRVYQDATESFKAHSSFITGEGRITNRYASLFSLGTEDYKGWANGLQKAGYATHPMYSRRLISLIEDYRLFTYDISGKPSAPEAPKGFFAGNDDSPFQKVNGLKSVYVDHMASPAEIAMDFNLPVDLIMKYNEILKEENAPINTPMNIFLEKKKKKNPNYKSFHLVKAGETLESISQLYGIQVKYLYRRNRIQEGGQPAVGSKVYLSRKSKFAPNLNTTEIQPESPVDQNLQIALPTNSIPAQEPLPAENENKTIQYIRTLEQPINGEEKEPEYYTVQEKDTLFGIARKFNITVASLKELNQLFSDAIQIGQQLKIR
jgi:LysM repeat protein